MQACRGEELDRGATAHDVTDATDTTSYVRVPKEADCLYAYSTAAGMYRLLGFGEAPLCKVAFKTVTA